MHELTNWLIGIEDASYGFYVKAAAVFSDDKGLAALLRHLADDEKIHGDVVRKAYDLIKNEKEEPGLITLDDDSRHGIEKELLYYGTKLDSGELTKDELVEAIVAIEFSECNDAFLCVLGVLRAFPDVYYSSASNIQQHKKYVEWFIKSRPEYSRLLEKISSLPDVMERNLLVVDDEEGMINIMNVVLSQEGKIENARNGAEALAKLEGKHFEAVITDVDMPVLDGIEFYNQAVRRHPYLKNRFVFLTGGCDESRVKFFKQNNLKNLMKPASIKDIKKTVGEVIRRA